MLYANVGSKPWYRCGCTDDPPRRLGDACSITLLPWFVTRMEPPVQLRKVVSDRGHLLTECFSDVRLHAFTCVDVEPGMRTAAAVAWEAAAKISLLVLALFLLDRGCCSSAHCSNTVCCSSTCCCCCCCCGRCSSTWRRWPQEAIRPSRWWRRIV